MLLSCASLKTAFPLWARRPFPSLNCIYKNRELNSDSLLSKYPGEEGRWEKRKFCRIGSAECKFQMHLFTGLEREREKERRVVYRREVAPWEKSHPSDPTCRCSFWSISNWCDAFDLVYKSSLFWRQIFKDESNCLTQGNSMKHTCQVKGWGGEKKDIPCSPSPGGTGYFYSRKIQTLMRTLSFHSYTLSASY